MTLIEAATILSDKYHNKIMGQVRKYTYEPYTVHVESVSEFYSQFFPDDYVGIASCKMHDSFEDTPLTKETLKTELLNLGINPNSEDVNEMIGLIIELTDVYTSKNYPNLNRAERKRLEAERLGKVSIKAKNIKLADLLDNTESIIEHDKNFARTYLKEKEYLLPFLKEGNSILYAWAVGQLNRNKICLNL